MADDPSSRNGGEVTGALQIDPRLLDRLYEKSRAARWSLSPVSFARQLEVSARRAFGAEQPDPRHLERYFHSLHLEDLAIACACAAGIETAWEHFVREFRPVLYRAADAIDRSGRSREIADSLYGELFGLAAAVGGERRSHFRYFHGRSSLATWLRAVLSQRYVDRIRQDRRVVALPADDEPESIRQVARPQEPPILAYVEIMRRVVIAIVAALPSRDRLRLGCYYAQNLTLAQIGRALGEHEATVSRQLARTRRVVREQVEAALRDQERMTDSEIAECFAAVLQDPGTLDVVELLGVGRDGALFDGRKEPAPDRST